MQGLKWLYSQEMAMRMDLSWRVGLLGMRIGQYESTNNLLVLLPDKTLQSTMGTLSFSNQLCML